VTAAVVSNLVLPRSSLETEEALVTFKDSFAKDVSKVLNISAQRIQVTGVTPAGDNDVEEIYNVLFNILSLPARVFNGTKYSTKAADLILPEDQDDGEDNSLIVPQDGSDPALVIDVAASAQDELSAIATSLATALADPNSGLYLGEITSQLTYGASTITVSDPSAQGPTDTAPQSKAGSSLGTGAVVGLCVAGAALIALAAVGTRFYQKRRLSGENKSSSGPSESSVSKSITFSAVPQVRQTSDSLVANDQEEDNEEDLEQGDNNTVNLSAAAFDPEAGVSVVSHSSSEQEQEQQNNDALPPHWAKHQSDEFGGVPYYVHELTGETTWEKPQA